MPNQPPIIFDFTTASFLDVAQIKDIFVDAQTNSAWIDPAYQRDFLNEKNQKIDSFEFRHPQPQDDRVAENNLRSFLNTEHPKFQEYIALASIGHLLDWWGYLSSSLDALLGQNENAAIHFAYYAELKATMAFLALHGIVNFNKTNIQIGPSCVELGNKQSTHYAIPPLFEKVLNESVLIQELQKKLFSTGFLPGFSVLEWQESVATSDGVSITANKVLMELVRDVTRDINDLKNDLKARNRSTYPPSQEYNCATSDQDIVAFLNGLKSDIAPTMSGAWLKIDGYVALRYLDQYFRAIPQISGEPEDSMDDEEAVFSLEKSLHKISGLAAEDMSTLSSAVASFRSSLVFKYALTNNAFPSPGYSLGIFSRALLMLSIAGYFLEILSPEDYRWKRLRSVLDKRGIQSLDRYAAAADLQEILEQIDEQFTSLVDWRKCPQLFDFKTLERVPAVALLSSE